MPSFDKQVFSSHVNSVAYDAEKREFAVTWDSGKTSIYSGVPDDLANEVSSAWSVGSAVREKIKGGGFAHRYQK